MIIDPSEEWQKGRKPIKCLRQPHEGTGSGQEPCEAGQCQWPNCVEGYASMSEQPKERPIPFGAPMVRAILAGRKSQTRRIMKPQPEPWKDFHLEGGCQQSDWSFKTGWQQVDAKKRRYGLWMHSNFHESRFQPCPYGGPGDYLWVKEGWGEVWNDDGNSRSERHVVYKADNGREPEDNWQKTPWKSPIFMPRSAARIMLEIGSIGVERLQQITNEEAIKEGVFFTDYGRRCGHFPSMGWIDYNPENCSAPLEHHQQREGWMWDKTTSHMECLHDARTAFFNLWEHINGEGSYAANPWLWVISFRRIDQNEERDAA